jgi:hypothetical protein
LVERRLVSRILHPWIFSFIPPMPAVELRTRIMCRSCRSDARDAM